MDKIDRVLFIGSKSLGLRCLEVIHVLEPNSLLGIVTFDDRHDARSEYDGFEAFAARTGHAIFALKHCKQLGEVIQQLEPELCVVVGWYWLIPEHLLRAVPSGFIGMHASLLPKYRGGSPLVWALINGDEEVGVSLFSFTESMDDGNIWGQCVVKVTFTDYISDILGKVEAGGISLLKEEYNAILNRTIKPMPQDHSKATYCAQRLASDGLINWGKPAVQVYDFIRAQSEPYPGAFTLYDDRKLTIWKAHPLDILYYGTPGQVARITEKGVYVICGDQRPIVLEIVQLEPGARQPANKIVKSTKARFTSFMIL